jgi:YHS domain-containing protein
MATGSISSIGGLYARRRGLAARHILPGSTTTEDPSMATATDPVCGMDVDTTTSQLSLEHDGTTYWFCGKGCMLEFQDDPDKYLDPDYKPSM